MERMALGWLVVWMVGAWAVFCDQTNRFGVVVLLSSSLFPPKFKSRQRRKDSIAPLKMLFHLCSCVFHLVTATGSR
ncbi:hypothetical protein BC567DRAFT_10254 [Phyllosticta citribraziliensis]